MRTGQVWVFLEIGLGIVFIITLFCLCRYFDLRKARNRKRKAKAADEDCYQRQLSQQRERALSIRREILMHETASNPDNAAAKEPLTAVEEKPTEEAGGKDGGGESAEKLAETA